tara:strand:- start:255 stop:359 length:105 start_codon:yes stop_codon:yes gene_type:complete
MNKQIGIIGFLLSILFSLNAFFVTAGGHDTANAF